MAGHDAQAAAALDRCNDIEKRLEEGIAVLADAGNDKALAAFRFANRAMAQQRIHSLFALSRRRGEKKTLADFEQRHNRSWRPFQLAFILLSIPSLADPTHKDRTKPIEAYRRFALVSDGRRQDRSLSGRRRLRDGHSPSSGKSGRL